ncbi:MAG: hypothetical protein BGO96_11920 [Micrococcales bacterium 73-15]|nr:MAG: hypothetical protein BGO96_11920 [Micrococcales bacterium 73-15]
MWRTVVGRPTLPVVVRPSVMMPAAMSSATTVATVAELSPVWRVRSLRDASRATTSAVMTSRRDSLRMSRDVRR